MRTSGLALELLQNCYKMTRSFSRCCRTFRAKRAAGLVEEHMSRWIRHGESRSEEFSDEEISSNQTEAFRTLVGKIEPTLTGLEHVCNRRPQEEGTTTKGRGSLSPNQESKTPKRAGMHGGRSKPSACRPLAIRRFGSARPGEPPRRVSATASPTAGAVPAHLLSARPPSPWLRGIVTKAVP